MTYILLFILGLVFGSFGSVILHRLGEHITWAHVRSVLIGRSHCPHCKHTLAWYDLFPLFSWLATRGKCRYCHAKVSHRYPLLEVGSGLIFLGVTYRWTLYGAGDINTLLMLLFTHWSLYLLLIYDIKTMYLHPVAWWMTLAGSTLLLFYQTDGIAFLTAAQWMFVFALGFIVFYLMAKIYVRIRRKEDAEGIGQGDVMLAPVVGVLLWKTMSMMGIGDGGVWINIIQYFWYYVIVACLASLLLLVVVPITHEGGKRMIPFFPGMIIGLWLVIAIFPWIASLF